MGTRDLASGWFGVRCIFRWLDSACFEERITLWKSDTFDGAIAKAEFEAGEYAEANGLIYLGLAQGFWIFGEQITEGTEVFSLLRGSDLDTEDYLDTFFDTGSERQSHWSEDGADPPAGGGEAPTL
jgi:hypothetical protein